MRTFGHRILDKFEGKDNAVFFRPCNIFSQPSIASISICINLYQFVSKAESNSASHVLFQQTYHSAVVKTYTTYLKSRIQTFNRGEEQ